MITIIWSVHARLLVLGHIQAPAVLRSIDASDRVPFDDRVSLILARVGAVVPASEQPARVERVRR